MAGLKPDRWIREMSRGSQKMIEPFSERIAGPKIVSYGLQPAGYDIRLGPEILIFDWARGQGIPLDPLALDQKLYSRKLALPFCDIPPRSFIQGMSVEYLRIPDNVSARGVGKTTYSSVGISVNVSGIHPGWEGKLRIHISNTTSIPLRVYGEQGILTLEFQELDGECEVPYGRLEATRFQGQKHFLAAPPNPGR